MSSQSYRKPEGAIDTKQRGQSDRITRPHESTRPQQDVEEDESNSCPECSGNVVQDKKGEETCEECGLVVDDEQIDHGPEWTAYSAKENREKSRTGTGMTKMMHDGGLSTVISKNDKDANGNLISQRKRMQMSRLRKWDNRFSTKSTVEQNQKKGLSEISRMASALGLPRAPRETASVIFQKASEDGILVGRSIEGIASAALYAGTRQSGNPRTLSEIAQTSHMPERQIARDYKYLCDQIGLKIPPEQPSKFIPRFISKASNESQRDFTKEDLSDVESTARELLKYAKEGNLLSGRDPTCLAAASLYIASKIYDVNLTQSTISEACDVSTVTIRSLYQEICDYIGSRGVNLAGI